MISRLLFLPILLIGLATTVSANKKYCTKYSDKQRQTSIYLDLSNTNEKEFALSLLRELKGNFIPHEKIKIFAINPVTAGIKRIYSSCAPILSPSEIAKVKAEGSMKYMLGGNPIDEANEAYSFFQSEIKSVLAKAYNKNVSDELDKKEMIEMLYGESSSFQSAPRQRVIIYSDMNQKSVDVPTQSMFDENNDFKFLTDYKIDFNMAEFYIYTGKKKHKISDHNKMIKFWRNYVELNNGHLAFINDALKLPKVKFIKEEQFEGSLIINDKKYAASMFVSYTNERESTNTWFVINELDAIPLNGKVALKNGKLAKAEFKLKRINSSYHPLFTGEEKFLLEVRGNNLTGIIKIDNSEIVLNGVKITNPEFIIEMVRKND